MVQCAKARAPGAAESAVPVRKPVYTMGQWTSRRVTAYLSKMRRMGGAQLVAVVALATVFGSTTVAPQGTPARSSAVSRADTIASVLRDWSRAGSLSGLRWPRFPYYRDELEALYSPVEWRPVWTADGRPTPDARTVLDLLATADERGLRSEDYDVPELRRRFDVLSGSRLPEARDVAWFDLAMSVGILRHLSDVRIGRVNPKNVAVGINIERKKLDLARFVRDALARGKVGEMVRDAEPKFLQYRNLKAAYARYRALAADSALPTVTLKRTARPGDSLDVTPALARRLAAFGDLSAGDGAAAAAMPGVYSNPLAAAVARFQGRHGLASDSVLGPATVTALNVSPARRARQLELALERIRWLPALDAGPFVVVNVPGFTLYAFDTLGTTGEPTLTMNVVVGRADVGRRTPIFMRDMRYIVFRPYWVIPPGILTRETLPAVRRNPNYLTRNDMELYRGSGDTGPSLPATSANLARVGRDGVGIRQRPGPNNSLGLAKFIFPNDHNVYLHGTPDTELFERTRRDFSHGCIRLEDPARFAEWVLRDPNAWSLGRVREAMEGKPSQRVNLTRPLPVVIHYATAIIRADGAPEFYPDIYGHDARLERELSGGYPFRP